MSVILWAMRSRVWGSSDSIPAFATQLPLCHRAWKNTGDDRPGPHASTSAGTLLVVVHVRLPTALVTGMLAWPVRYVVCGTAAGPIRNEA